MPITPDDEVTPECWNCGKWLRKNQIRRGGVGGWEKEAVLCPTCHKETSRQDAWLETLKRLGFPVIFGFPMADQARPKGLHRGMGGTTFFFEDEKTYMLGMGYWEGAEGTLYVRKGTEHQGTPTKWRRAYREFKLDWGDEPTAEEKKAYRESWKLGWADTMKAREAGELTGKGSATYRKIDTKTATYLKKHGGKFTLA
jgi:hypothetical protein